MFTSYAMIKILNGIFQGAITSNPATLYFGGFPVAPTRAGGGTESQYPNYARPGLTATVANWANPAGASVVSIANNVAILFPQAGAGTSENWPAIAHFDALTGGNMWAYYLIPSNPPLGQGSIIQIGVGELVGQIALNTNGGFTTYAAMNILACMYQKKSVALGLTNLYLGGFTTPPTIAGTGTESGGGSRVSIPCNPANWTGASGTNPVVSSNTNPATFPVLNVTETWVGWALFDSPTPGTGNMWHFGVLQTPINVNNNSPSFPIGSIQPIMTGIS
jgi:hypothetical protein